MKPYPAILAACLTVAGCVNGDVLDASYANRAEAESEGAMDRGWIPAWIPADSRGLREVHNLDTSESALAFDLAAGSNWRPPSPCRAANGGEFVETRFDRSWIPSLNEQFRYFSCPQSHPFGAPMFLAVAISPDDRRVLLWRGYAR